jgi:hypothetical protein
MENENLAVMLKCVQAPIISENLMDVGAQLQAKLDMIRAFPKDREHAAMVKKLRAECNKAFKEAEDGRKAVKQECLLPYEKAMKLYDGFVKSPFGVFDAECKSFIDQVEGQEKAECEAQLKEYFADLCAMKGIHWLKWERMGIKVDLATARLAEPKKAMEAIKSKVDKICADLDLLSAMEGSTEYLAEYENCLDVSEAIRRVNARKDAQRIAEQNKADREARQAQAARLRQTAAAEAPVVAKIENEKKFQVTFTITATMPMLRGLKMFLDGHNYEYQEVRS